MTLTVDSDLNGASPQFTLTCISTGGPATTVTWTRDSITVTEGTETVLDDPVTAQYTHTLTVTGRLAGLYTCTVANNKPSSDSALYHVKGIIIHMHKITLKGLLYVTTYMFHTNSHINSIWAEAVPVLTADHSSAVDASIDTSQHHWLSNRLRPINCCTFL